MDKAIWKDIVGYDGVYQVSNVGEVKGLSGTLKQGDDTFGYLKVVLCDKDKNRCNKKVHRLVAEAFINNPSKKPQTNHKNGVKSDNRVENLEWCTRLENMKHASKNNLVHPGERTHTAKLNEHQVKRIRLMKEITSGLTQQRIAEMFKVTPQNVYKILNGGSWKHIL